MLGHTRNAISAYQKAGMEVAVEVADPYRLILLLFEGAQAAVGSARAAIAQKQIAAKGLEQVEKEFRYGTKTSSALIDAENDLQNAELELQTAIFNQRRAAIELMKSTQNLNPENL